MESLPITLVLAGAAAIFLVLISFPIANRRRATKLSAGDGGDERFNRPRARAHEPRNSVENGRNISRAHACVSSLSARICSFQLFATPLLTVF
jgi:hypothetical protein